MITTERLSTWRAVAAELDAAGRTVLAGDLRRATEELAKPVLVTELPKPMPCPRCGAAYIAHGALWLHPTADCLDAMRTYWPGQVAALNRRALCPKCAQLREELDSLDGVTEDRDAVATIRDQAEELEATRRKWDSDKRLLAGALRLLDVAGIPPDSQDLLSAAELENGRAEELARLRSEVHMFRTAAVPAMARMADELALLRRVAGPGSAEGDRIDALAEWVETHGGPAK